MDKDLNVRALTIIALKENIRVNLYDVGSADDFLDLTSRTQATKEKNILDLLKI